jgi:hypothetical protein
MNLYWGWKAKSVPSLRNPLREPFLQPNPVATSGKIRPNNPLRR